MNFFFTLLLIFSFLCNCETDETSQPHPRLFTMWNEMYPDKIFYVKIKTNRSICPLPFPKKSEDYFLLTSRYGKSLGDTSCIVTNFYEYISIYDTNTNSPFIEARIIYRQMRQKFSDKDE